MAKMTKAKRLRKGIDKEPRWQLNAGEVYELGEIHRLAIAERLKANQVSANTALFPDGQKYAEQLEMTAKLCENYKNNWLAQKFIELGHAPGTHLAVDSTGKIRPAV